VLRTDNIACELGLSNGTQGIRIRGWFFEIF